MTKVIASGVPEKYPEYGKITITVTGDPINISNIEIEAENEVIQQVAAETLDEDMARGPSYPLCAEPETMRCIFFVLLEWFGEDKSAWIKEPEHVKIAEGEIEPMESDPDMIY